MDRVQLPTQTSSPSFIGAWNLSDASVCDAMIQFFNSESAQKKVGEIGSGIQPELKKSVDITIEPRFLEKAEYSPFKNYLKQLNECYELYKTEWPFLTGFLDTVHVGTFNVQRYLKGDHFKAVHAERMSLANSHRLLAWMTYLNDVDDGGETVFHALRRQCKAQERINSYLARRMDTRTFWRCPQGWRKVHCNRTLPSASCLSWSDLA